MFAAFLEALKRLLFRSPPANRPGPSIGLHPDLPPPPPPPPQDARAPDDIGGSQTAEAPPAHELADLPPASDDPRVAAEADEEDEDDEDEDEDEDEDAESETEEENELSPPASVCRPSEEVAAEIATARRLAEQEALSGEHRLYPWTAVGPGSLGEALLRLSQQGVLGSEFVDDGAEAYLRYRRADDARAAIAAVLCAERA